MVTLKGKIRDQLDKHSFTVSLKQPTEARLVTNKSSKPESANIKGSLARE